MCIIEYFENMAVGLCYIIITISQFHLLQQKTSLNVHEYMAK